MPWDLYDALRDMHRNGRVLKLAPAPDSYAAALAELLGFDYYPMAGIEVVASSDLQPGIYGDIMEDEDHACMVNVWREEHVDDKTINSVWDELKGRVAQARLEPGPVAQTLLQSQPPALPSE